MNNKMECILSRFDIAGFENISMVDDNKAVFDVDNKYILKKTTSGKQCKAGIEISRQLSEKNIAVAEFIPLKSGQFYLQDAGYFYSLMRKINGKPINIGESGSYAAHIGELVAYLNCALKTCACEFCPEMDCIETLNGWVRQEIEKELLPVTKEIFDYLDSFEPLYRMLPRQIIHKDLNGNNMLFNENMMFQGFIDFDIAEINARAYDISYLLQCLFIGVPKDKNSEKFNQRYKVASCIFKSYDNIVHLTDEEKQSIPYFFIYIGVMLSAWFSKCGNKGISASCIEGTEQTYINRHLFTFD